MTILVIVLACVLVAVVAGWMIDGATLRMEARELGEECDLLKQERDRLAVVCEGDRIQKKHLQDAIAFMDARYSELRAERDRFRDLYEAATAKKRKPAPKAKKPAKGTTK